MADPASDVLKGYQAMAQQSWDAWTNYLQQQTPPSAGAAKPASSSSTSDNDDLLARCKAALESYGDWLKGAAATASAPAPGTDWQDSLKTMFGGFGSKTFADALGGFDSQGASQVWESWLASVQSGKPFNVEHLAAFGVTRERQLQQQALAAAMQEYMDKASKYQALIQQAHAEGFAQLQARLAGMASPSGSAHQVDSLKALYDMWVDGAEEAYARIAMSDDFRQIYGDMVNAQSRVRQLQQQQLDLASRELGMPTRKEVDAIGQRLQELRREVRASAAQQVSAEVKALRAEVAALKRQLTGKASPVVAAKKAAPSTARASDDEDAPRRAKPAPRKTTARKAAPRSNPRTKK